MNMKFSLMCCIADKKVTELRTTFQGSWNSKFVNRVEREMTNSLAM
jgi:hypothetical protein